MSTAGSRRNHYIPRGYLRCFADNRGLLHGVELPGGRGFAVAVGDAAVQNNLYTVELENGEVSDALERGIAIIELETIRGLRALRAEFWPPDLDTRGRVANFMALQLMRVPAFFEVTESPESLARHGIPPDLRSERLRAWSGSMMLERASYWVEPFAIFGWELVEAPFGDYPFLTSDFPVWIDIDEDNVWWHKDMSYPCIEASMPIDPHRVLILRSPNRGDQVSTSPTSERIQDLNGRAIELARRFVYGSPKTIEIDAVKGAKRSGSAGPGDPP